MATKKCPNGHKYDSSIYGDKCPFCPTNNGGGTAVSGGGTAMNGGNTVGNFVPPAGATAPINMPPSPQPDNYNPTLPMNDSAKGGEAGGPHTVVHPVDDGSPNPDGGRKVIGVLVSYSENPAGEVFKIFEGRNIIGRDATCDIRFSKDKMMSEKHICILFVEAEGVVWIEDQKSSNGTYVNNSFARGMIELHTGDIITAGKSKMVFLRVPEF